MKNLVPTKNSPSSDLVETPRPLAKAVVDALPISGRVLDPSAGASRVFYRLFQKKPGVDVAYYLEIGEGTDFLTWKDDTPLDWIVTNPPWSKYRAFAQKAYELASNVAYLTTINHDLALKARIRDMRESNFGIREVLLLDTPRRPDSFWPQSGFQLGVVWKQKGYTGPATFRSVHWEEAKND